MTGPIPCPDGTCRAGMGDACPARTLPHHFYCERLDPSRPGYDPRYLPIVRGEVVAAPIIPDPRLALVAACPDRGSVLPHTLQPEGCGCGELTECRAGRGKMPGRVCLAECLDCVARPDSPARSEVP